MVYRVARWPGASVFLLRLGHPAIHRSKDFEGSNAHTRDHL